MSEITITMPLKKYERLKEEVANAHEIVKLVSENKNVIWDRCYYCCDDEALRLIKEVLTKKYSAQHEKSLTDPLVETIKKKDWAIKALKEQITQQQKEIQKLKTENTLWFKIKKFFKDKLKKYEKS